MKKCISIAAAFILLLLAITIHAGADDWLPPRPFEIWSEDRNRVFRFDPDSHRDVAQAAVYRSDNLRQPIYTVENLRAWAYEENFFFSRDFQHFVFRPPADFHIALQFYSNGILMRTHYIQDLVVDMDRVLHSTTTAWWGPEDQRTVWIEFFPENDRLAITTIEEITYIFDITTGEILKDTHPILPIIVLITVGGAVFVCFFFFWKRKKEPNSKTSSHHQP